MKTTRHGEDRMKQRGIPPLIVDACVAFGCERKAKGGAVSIFSIEDQGAVWSGNGGGWWCDGYPIFWRLTWLLGQMVPL